MFAARFKCSSCFAIKKYYSSQMNYFIKLSGRRDNEFRVTVGDWNNKQQDEFQQEFEVERIYKHYAYDAITHDYDIALIKLSRNRGKYIQFYDKIQSACLPTRNQEYTSNTKCLISGWGTMGKNLLGIHRYPTNLQAAIVPLIDQNLCQRLHNSVTQRMFCAGYMDGDIDTCKGDSGGPLVCRIDGAYTVMGVTSWGSGCANDNSPGVYAKVNYFVPWIKDLMFQ